MKSHSILAPLLLLVAGCGGDEAIPPANETAAADIAAEPAPAPSPPPPRRDKREAPVPEPAGGWDVAASGEGTALFLAGAGKAGERAITFFCPSGSGELLVNVPAFRAVESEERMSFGAGATAVALVADSRGDRLRGGVSATGPLPSELDSVLAGPARLSVSYGAQQAGPFDAPPKALTESFLAGCRG